QAAEAPTAVGPRQRGGDDRSPVTARRPVAPVAEALHELGEGRADPDGAPPRVRGRTGETVARYRRCDHVERVRRVATVGGWIRQRPDDLDELEDRPRPTVDEQERHG